MTTTKDNGRVVLGYGPQDLDFMSKAAKLCGNKAAVLDQDVARMAGAIMAVGTPEALAELRKRLEAGALQAENAQHGGKLPAAAIEWLASGKRGISSNTIFTRLSGIDALNGWHEDHPHDPSDFNRCRQLLDKVPEFRERLHEMAEVSPVWASLVEHWDEIVSLIDEESSTGRCPKAYKLIKELIEVAPV